MSTTAFTIVITTTPTKLTKICTILIVCRTCIHIRSIQGKRLMTKRTELNYLCFVGHCNIRVQTNAINPRQKQQLQIQLQQLIH